MFCFVFNILLYYDFIYIYSINYESIIFIINKKRKKEKKYKKRK